MQELPDDVERFIAEHLDNNLEQLEILLLLRGNPSREFTPAQVTGELRLGPESAPVRLTTLAQSGFVVVRGEPPLYRYQPDTGDKDRVINELARCYAERKVSVITQIFSPRKDAARSFADAFKLRRR